MLSGIRASQKTTPSGIGNRQDNNRIKCLDNRGNVIRRYNAFLLA